MRLVPGAATPFGARRSFAGLRALRLAVLRLAALRAAASALVVADAGRSGAASGGGSFSSRRTASSSIALRYGVG
jgi:hypothetical protein